MTAGFGSVDGRLVSMGELVVPATDRGLLLGDAVFETMRTYEGRLFALGEHLDRLEASLRGVRITDAPARDVLARWAREAVIATRSKARGAKECVVRVTVTRGDGPHGISVRHAGPARVVVIARPLAPAPHGLYERGIRVVTASVQRAPPGVQDPTIKATSALNLILARLEADRVDADEALLTNAQGEYLEASAANLFALRDGTFWTPRGKNGVLEGVTAAVVERILLDEGFQARHAAVPPDVLFSAEEVFLTQTTREVLPVVQVDDRAIGKSAPGPVAGRVREAFLAQRGAFLDTA